MGKENASKQLNCIILMFLTSFNVFFVIGYGYFIKCIIICFKTAIIWHFWDKVWLFLVKTGWQLCVYTWRFRTNELVILCCGPWDSGTSFMSKLLASLLRQPLRGTVLGCAYVPSVRGETGCFLGVIQQSKVVGSCPGVQACSHCQEMFCCNPSWHVGSWSHQHTDRGVGMSGRLLVSIASVEFCKC